jgi:hypothetical protein
MRAEMQKQREVESFWNEKPCDSDLSHRIAGTREYFRDIEQERYSLQSHIKEVLAWVRRSLKSVPVLEPTRAR